MKTKLLLIALLSIHGQSLMSQPGVSNLRANPANIHLSTEERFNKAIYCLAMQSDGKVIVGGDFTNFNGTQHSRIVRLSSDGSSDISFYPGSGFNGAVRTLALLPNGKIMVGGDFTAFNGISRNRIARLHANGTLDFAFDPGTGFPNGHVCTFAPQPDGKVIVGGYFTSFNGIEQNNITRLLEDGHLDTSFNAGKELNHSVLALALQPDGKILIGGAFFSFSGKAHNRIARLHSDGSLDASFDSGNGFDVLVNALALQPDGKLLVGGQFNTYDDKPRNRIARLHTDGRLDDTFNPENGFGTGNVLSFALQDDGKILTGGTYNSFNGTERNRIARLHPNGSLDVTFGAGLGADFTIYALKVQLNGNIIVAGDFTSFDGDKRNRITILNSDGYLENTSSVSKSSSSLSLDEKQAPTSLNDVNAEVRIDLEDEIKVFPNPTRGQVTVHLPATMEQAIISLSDATGHILWQQEASGKTEINLGRLPKGLYLLRIVDNQSVFIHRIVKQ